MKTKAIKLNSIILFTVVITLFNCKGKQGDPGPAGSTGSTGPSLSGTIQGVLTLTSSNGTQPTDMSGVTVKTNKGDSAVTNTSGEWSLNEVTGIYTLTFTKAGYGTTTVNGYNFAGGGTSYLNTVALSQTPLDTVGIVLDTVGGNSSATKDLHINVTLNITFATAQTEDREFFIYYSTSSSVSSSNYMGMVTVAVPATQTTYKTTITGSDFLAAQIAAGQVVYVVAYPSATSAALSSKYVNESIGKTVYTALGPVSVTENMQVPH